jgi:predicted TIM-barrel fold metal-dependent hydrolase
MSMFSRRRFVASSLAVPIARALGQVRLGAVPLIDSHVHIWKHDAAFPFAEGARPPAVDASVEMLVELMKANGVLRTVIVQVIHYRWDNRYLADVLRRHPGVFKGVCRVDPQSAAAPDELARLTEKEGFHGVRLSPGAAVDGDWIRGPLMPALWGRCAELKVPMTLLIPASRIADVEPLIRANPGLQVVIDHMADVGPGQISLLLGLAKYPKVFVKISHLWSLSKEAYPYADMVGQVKSLVGVFGASRLMWGTDWPISLKQLSYAQAVGLYRDHLDYLSARDREQILYRTVQEVWGFGVS